MSTVGAVNSSQTSSILLYSSVQRHLHDKVGVRKRTVYLRNKAYDSIGTTFRYCRELILSLDFIGNRCHNVMIKKLVICVN